MSIESTSCIHPDLHYFDLKKKTYSLVYQCKIDYILHCITYSIISNKVGKFSRQFDHHGLQYKFNSFREEAPSANHLCTTHPNTAFVLIRNIVAL